MDYIDELFATGMLKKQDLSPAIRTALSLAKGHSTVIILLRTHLSCIGLLWVRHLTCTVYVLTCGCSSSSSEQARLLQTCWLISQMDFDSKTTRDEHLQQLLCIPSHSKDCEH
jgi:hypothetical protein